MAADAPGTLPVQLVEQPRWVAALGPGPGPGPAARSHGRNGAAEARRHLSRGGRAVCRRAGEVGGQVGRSVSKPLA